MKLAVAVALTATGLLPISSPQSPFLTGRSGQPATDVALDYVKAHPEVYKLSAADLATLKLRKDYVDELGTHHVFWTQELDDLEVFGKGLKANVTKHGELISIVGGPVRGLTGQARSRSAAPTLSAATARAAAAADIDGTPATAAAKTTGSTVKWSNGDRAKLVWFESADGLRKGWSTYVNAGTNKVFTHVVDAQTGKLHHRKDLTRAAHGDALVQDNYPGAPSGGVQRVENLIHRKWLLKNAKTLLEGTSVSAFADANDNDQPDPGETVAVPNGQHKIVPFQSSSFCATAFVCTWDPAEPDSWKANKDQSVTNAFYLAGNFHDWLAKPPIAFTPAAGSFDAAGGDPVKLNALDGAGTGTHGGPDEDHVNNAYMATPPDGMSPVMAMFLFHAPGGDDVQEPWVPASGTNSADVLYHEYGHGMNARLVVDAYDISALNNIQSGAMDEAWADFYALDYLVAHGLERDTTASGDLLVGKYVAGGKTIRTMASDCRVHADSPQCVQKDGTKGGYTYGDFPTIGRFPERHASGELWTQTLWDLRERLGRADAVRVITRAMELSPPDPSLLDMRNAILQADLVATGGKRADAIWQVFANRGLGWFAGSVDGGDAYPAEDFQLPPKAAAPRLTGTVREKYTNAPVAGAQIVFSGHASGFAGSYVAVTDAQGKYAVPDVRPGTYRKVIIRAAGHEALLQDVTVRAGRPTDFTPRRNWAGSEGGAQVVGFNGLDRTEDDCGPAGAIDGSQDRGWVTSTGNDNGDPTNVMIPKHLDLKLPQPIDVAAFSVDPAPDCATSPTAATGKYRIETSADGKTWATARTGEFTAADLRKFNELTPTANTAKVRYVRFWILSPQVPNFATACPDNLFGSGCAYSALTELQVFGKQS
ncbi:hypothetical protein GCM10009534_68990 [Kribbella sandramycini]